MELRIWPWLDVNDECIVKRSAKIVNRKTELSAWWWGPGMSPREHAARRGRFCGLGGLDKSRRDLRLEDSGSSSLRKSPW
jgi:hypothetical protein